MLAIDELENITLIETKSVIVCVYYKKHWYAKQKHLKCNNRRGQLEEAVIWLQLDGHKQTKNFDIKPTIS